jgi:hypothetical protein
MNKSMVNFYLFLSILLLIGCSDKGVTASKGKTNESFNNLVELSSKDEKIIQRSYSLGKEVNFSQDSISRKIMGKAHEVRLKYLAKGLAVAARNKKIRDIIFKSASEKFDGDTEVLWSMIKDKYVDNQKLRSFVDKIFIKDENGILSISELEQVPLLNIGFRAGFENYNTDKPIKVGYSTITKEDTENEDVILYDSNLKKYKVSTRVKPDYPVVIVGINERVDPVTHEVDVFSSNSSLSRITAGERSVSLSYLNLKNDKESWSQGAAEVFTKRTFQYENENSSDYVKKNKQCLGHNLEEKVYDNDDPFPKCIITYYTSYSICNFWIQIKIKERDKYWWGTDWDIIEDCWSLVDNGNTHSRFYIDSIAGENSDYNSSKLYGERNNADIKIYYAD